MAYKQVRVGDYFKFEKGLGYKGEFLVNESDVALIGMDSHEEGGGYKEKSEKPYSGPFKVDNVLNPGDVVFAATDLSQDGHVLGSPLLVPESDEFQTFIYSHHLLKAFPLKEDFLPEYLYNIYRTSKYRVKAAYADSGTTVRALPAEVLEEQMVPLPDLPTQQAINEIISMIDQQIANNKALSKNLETLAQSIFKSWFVDFDPVHAKSKGEKPFGMDDATAKLFPDSFEDSEIGSIPKGWHSGAVSEVISLQGGFAFKSASWTESGVPVIKIGSVKPGFVDLNQGSFISFQLAAEISDVYRLTRGSLVIGLSGYVGEVGLVPMHEPTPLLNQRVAKISPKNNDGKIPFVYCLTRDPAFKLDVINAANGSAQQNVSNTQICSILRPISDSNLRDAFNTLMEEPFASIIQKFEENIQLELLRNTLLPQLVTGDLQVPKELISS